MEMKKHICILLVFVSLFMLLTACSSTETIPETTEAQVQQPEEPSLDDAKQSEESSLDDTKKPVVTQPQQNMCYWCDEMPVNEDEIYCVNCRCLKCGELRKGDGRKYLYCQEHNCNASWCEYPAFEDSQYCSEHKCSKSNCDNQKWSGSEYCGIHK